jgi:hypothetical protein
MRRARVFNPAGTPEPGSAAMETGNESTPPTGMRRVATVLIRVAVGFLLASAVTVAVVAAGLDLFPLRP